MQLRVPVKGFKASAQATVCPLWLVSHCDSQECFVGSFSKQANWGWYTPEQVSWWQLHQDMDTRYEGEQQLSFGRYNTVRSPHVPGSTVSSFGCRRREGYRRGGKWRRTFRRVIVRREGEAFWGEGGEARGSSRKEEARRGEGSRDGGYSVPGILHVSSWPTTMERESGLGLQTHNKRMSIKLVLDCYPTDWPSSCEMSSTWYKGEGLLGVESRESGKSKIHYWRKKQIPQATMLLALKNRSEERELSCNWQINQVSKSHHYNCRFQGPVFLNLLAFIS